MPTTTVVRKHLFNDNFHEQTCLFMWNGKGWAGSKLAERQTERDIPLLRKGCGMINKLDHLVKLYTRAREGKIQGLIKMVIQLIPRISDGRYSLGAVSFHPASKLPIYTTLLLLPYLQEPILSIRSPILKNLLNLT